MTDTSTLINAVAYARFSSDNQREESIEAQVRAIKYYAQNFGINIIHVYADRAKTGKNDNRPQFQLMLEHSKSGEFDMVLVHKLDRFSRNPADTNYYEKVLNQNGVKLVSVLEKLDDTPEGQLMKQIIIGMNSFYSANLAREVRKGLKENAMKKKFTGGKVNLGYKVIDGKYEIDEEQAKAVKRIYELCIKGYGKTRIAKTLYEEGYKNPKGGRLGMFAPRTIYDIIRNEKYIGRFTYTIAGETIISEDTIPPIIDDETWLKAQETLSEKTKPKHAEGNQNYMLTGKFICGECGEAYTGCGSRKGRYGRVYHYYKCKGHKLQLCSNTSINKDTIEGLIIDEIVEKILEDNVVDEIASQAVEYANKGIEEPPVSISDLTKQEAGIKTKIDRLMDLYVDGAIDKAVLNSKVESLQADLKIIQTEKRKTAQLMSCPKLEKSDFVEFLKAFRFEENEYSEELAESLIDTFVEKVTIFYDKIEVVFKIDFDIIGGGRITTNSTTDTEADAVVSIGRSSGVNRTIPPITFIFNYDRNAVKKKYTQSKRSAEQINSDIKEGNF